MKNTRLSFALIMGIFSVMFLNSCSSSRGFEGYYPENRINGKGYGYNNVEQPTQTVQAPAEEVVVVEEAPVAPVAEDVVTPTEVATAPTAPSVDITTLTPREQRWIKRLGVAQVIDPAAAPVKTNFIERGMQKLFSKIATRAANKHFDGADIQRMDIADIFAIVSLASGGMAFITFYGVFLFGIAAIVFGVLALKRGTSRRGMAIAGIVLGAVALFFWILLFGFVFGNGWFIAH
ncbi:hypothetical protein BH09BAC1_BH09BAC1_21500 [soil metagenome]